MKIFKKLLLINWHHFEFEEFDFNQSNYLSGGTGVGKSTLLDALQLLLLADTSGRYFNKAARDKSERTVKDYLRRISKSQDGENYIYLRNGHFSSYVVGEFYDDVKHVSFCIGVIYETYNDGTDDHRFFSIKDAIPENKFLDGNEIPMLIRTAGGVTGLLDWLKKNYKASEYSVYDSLGSYKEDFRAKMGNIDPRFETVFRKAMTFSTNQIPNIKSFITQYVVDVPNQIDIEDMLENIRYYKQIEAAAARVGQQIEMLQSIHDLFDDYVKESERLKIYQFLNKRSELEEVFQERDKAYKSIEDDKLIIESCTKKIGELEDQIRELSEKKERLSKELYSGDLAKIKADLEEKKKQLNEKIDTINESIRRLKRDMVYILSSWNQALSLFEKYGTPAPVELKTILSEASTLGASYENINKPYLSALQKQMRPYHTTAQNIVSGINLTIEKLKEEIAGIQTRISQLEKGRKSYGDNGHNVISLLSLIEQRLTEKYQKSVKPIVLTDAVEVKDEKWRNALEGYLNTQKFNLIIEPEYFIEALKIYDQAKRNMNLYGVGLVDVQKIMENSSDITPGSLAEELETRNSYARAYVNYLLGRVMKCERVEDLRKHNIAITPSCMLYQGFVARQLNPKIYETIYLGQKAIAVQIEQNKKLLSEKENEYKTQSSRYNTLSDALSGLEVLHENKMSDLLEYAQDALKLPNTKADLNKVIDDYSSYDFSNLRKLEKQVKETETLIQQTQKERDDLKDKRTSTSERRNITIEEKIPNLEKYSIDKEREVNAEFHEEWRMNVGEVRFREELKKKNGNPTQLKADFSGSLGRYQINKTMAWNQVINSRREFDRNYKTSLNVDDLKNDAWDKELKRLKDTEFVEYQAKIQDARQKAQQQFREDFISKLRDNIDTVQDRIEELNADLRAVPIGDVTYEFVYPPNELYRRFYEMIMSDMLVEGISLFSNVFMEKHGETVDELFKLISDVDDNASDSQQDEWRKNLEKFTDYCTYLDFDLMEKHKDGGKVRVSKSLFRDSGGEGQTPFLVSMLASLRSIYNVKERGYDNTLRLIILDEAFSQMDDIRTKDSLDLISKLGFQVILAAPDRIAPSIIPIVDRTFVLYKQDQDIIVTPFDRSRIEVGA